MTVHPKGQCYLNYLRGAYPFQTQPAISLPDHTLNAALGNCSANSGFTVDQIAGCGYAQPFFVPHNQKSASTSGGATGTIVDENDHVNALLPDWIWDTVTMVGASTAAQNFRAKFGAHQTLDFVWNSTSAPSSSVQVTLTKHLGVDAEPDPIQGFISLLSRSLYNQIPAGLEPYYDIRFEINAVLYSVKVSSATNGVFRFSTDSGATWQDVAPLKFGGPTPLSLGSTPPKDGQNQIAIEVLLINRTLQIKLSGQQSPYAIPLDLDGAEPVLDRVTVVAKIFTQFNCEIHPLKFLSSASMRSNPLELGFSPANTPYYYLTGIAGVVTRASGVVWNVSFPGGSTITVTRVGATTNQQPQYDVLITNTVEGAYAGINYAARTAALVRTVIHVDGIWASVPTVATSVRPREMSLSTRFDPVGLTIQQTANLTFNNFYGQWAGQAGNIAVQLNLGYANPSTAYFPQFTGMCGDYDFQRPTSNQGLVSFECHDLMQLLADPPIFAPPLMDGWNHYYAIAFLAQMAGITTSQMAFSAMIPSDPFSFSGSDPTPYFLPLGKGMRPWTPRNQESQILSLMNYVRKPTGFLLYFDAQGYLQYHKWIPPSAAAPVRTFTEGPTGTDGANLTEFFNFRLRSSVADVRNQILLIGIDAYDPRWRFIVEKLEDTASIYASPGSEPQNYKGYKHPFVWTDSRFANTTFATEAALRLYQMLRIPGLHASFTCWMQPDIYPMDVVYIQESKSGVASVPFYVMEVHHSWSVSGGARSTISGKFLA